MPPAVLNGPVTVSLHQSLIQPGTTPTSRCKALAKTNEIAFKLDPGSRSLVLCEVGWRCVAVISQGLLT